MESDQIESECNSKLHRDDIEFNPDALKVLVLFIHKFVHPDDLLDKLVISVSLSLVKEMELFFKRFQLGFTPDRAGLLAVAV